MQRLAAGMAHFSWALHPGAEERMTLNLTIPAGCGGSLLIPGSTNMTVEEGGHVVWASGTFVPSVKGVVGGDADRDGVRLRTTAGTFRLVATTGS